MTTAGASANVVRGWFTSADPVARLKPQAAAVRSWAAQESVALKRYQQWLSMPFEDVGYGQILSPNCAHILLAHRLYLCRRVCAGSQTPVSDDLRPIWDPGALRLDSRRR